MLQPSERKPYEQVKAEKDGWSREILAVTSGYRLACCDCGLVHEMDFANTKEDAIRFKVRRLNRSTANSRRYKKPHWGKTFLQYCRLCITEVYMAEPVHSVSIRKRFIKSLAKDLGLNVRFD